MMSSNRPVQLANRADCCRESQKALQASILLCTRVHVHLQFNHLGDKCQFWVPGLFDGTRREQIGPGNQWASRSANASLPSLMSEGRMLSSWKETSVDCGVDRKHLPAGLITYEPSSRLIYDQKKSLP